MPNGVVGLIGAVVGAFAALTAVFLTHYFTNRREDERHTREQAAESSRWLREQKQICYHNAVKYLIRVRSIGARANKTLFLCLPDDAPLGWYDDIAEANAWLSSLHYYCGEDQCDVIGETSAEFINLSNWLIGFRPTGIISKNRFLHILSEEGKLDYQGFVDLMNQIENNISNCARREFH